MKKVLLTLAIVGLILSGVIYANLSRAISANTVDYGNTALFFSSVVSPYAGGIHMQGDYQAVYFGSADQSDVHYDGSSLIINNSGGIGIVKIGDGSTGFSKLTFPTSSGNINWRYTGSTGVYSFGTATGGYTFGGNVNATSYSVGGTAGFTGTGAYTNFTIVNGIITNAF